MKKSRFTFDDIFRPAVSSEVASSLDRTNVENMYHLSGVICIFELLILLTFTVPALIGGTFDRSTLVSFLSVLYCLVVCAVFIVLSGRLRKAETVSHGYVVLLTVLYFILMTAWSISVTLRHYRQHDDQMTTFFAVVLCFVCFVSFRPAVSLPLTFASFAVLYALLWNVDRGGHVDIYNYIVLALVTATCFVVHYRLSVRTAENNLELRRNYEELHYVSRHDALTGALNRNSLAADVTSYLGKQITIIMTDIDYFKQFNDRYGHAVGDEVLVEMFGFIKSCLPDCTAYRYGGDEFLVLLKNVPAVDALHVCRTNPGFSKAIGDETAFVRIGFGISSGIPESSEAFSKLVSDADLRLYEMKRETHKND